MKKNYSIEVCDFSFKYPNQDKKSLDNINLKINQGEFVTICGQSGSGKSTLLKHMKTVFAPNGTKTGHIFIEGQDLSFIDQREQSQKIGFVMQNPDSQIVTDKVWHELAFGLESLGVENQIIRRRVSEIASFFGIEQWFYKSVSELSGGQKQLLNLASIMVMQPSMLILDEPTSQLDPIAASEFIEIISKINRELGTTIIMTEHRLEDVFSKASLVFVIEEGKIICKGTPKQVGMQLKQRQNSMFLAMPTPMRIWAAAKSNDECPITVSEGKAWFERQYSNQQVTKTLYDHKKNLSEDNAILIENLWFKYEKNLKDVVSGLNLNVKKGEFFTLLGGNGAGKSTTLGVISGLKKAYRGNIILNGKVGILPQNPQVLFVKNTVISDLRQNIDDEKQILDIINLCKLKNLLNRHPYDLSGGEQQRVALAKVLLQNPDILLLDEPTKGLDAEFKVIFSDILKQLSDKGKTIFMVSHDIEFCARYSDRCGLFFNGSVVSQETTRKFFSGNSFYTTTANKMCRGVSEDIITDQDAIYILDGKLEVKYEYNDELVELVELKQQKTRKKTSRHKKTISFLCYAAIIWCFLKAISKTDLSIITTWQGMESVEYISIYIVLILSTIFLAINTYEKKERASIKTKKTKLSKRTIIASVLILIFIPITLYVGITFLGGKKYYITSILVLIQCILPFFLIFEGRKPKSRELVVISVICALAVAGRAAFFMLPQFKPVLAIVIVAGVSFGAETGFLVGAITMLVSNIMFSQGPWTPWQMFAMGIIGFLAGVLFEKGILKQDKVSLCIFGGFSAVIIYGLIMNFSSAIIWSNDLNVILTYFLTGLPMDLIHGFSTVLFLWFGAEPMLEKLSRVRIKYGLV